MKKTAGIFLLIMFTCMLFASCESADKNPTKPAPVKQVGTAPDLFDGNVLTKQLLIEAAEVPDGYLLVNDGHLEGNGIEKYDKFGELLWRKRLPFSPDLDFSRNSVIIKPLSDGNFVLGYDVYTHQNEDGTWVAYDAVLAKCSKDGNLLWQYTFDNFADSIIERIFETDTGNIIIAGSGREDTEPQIGGLEDIYLFSFSQEGKLLNSVKYGGSDFDYLQDAEYVSGVGLAALFTSQSRDGTFSASKDGYGVDILALIDDLNIKWHRPFGTFMSLDSLIATEEAIYLLDLKNNCYKVDYNGNTLLNKSIAEKSAFVHYVSNGSNNLVLQVDDKVLFYDNDFNVKRTIDFDAGDVNKLITTDEGFVIASINITGQLKSPPIISSIWCSSEIVYSGYNKSGKLIWRISHDITPQGWYDYNSNPSEWDYIRSYPS